MSYPGSAGRVAALSIALALGAGIAWDGVAAAAREQVALQALSEALEDLVAMPGGPPGAAAIVQRGANISFYAAGVGDLRTNRKIHAGDHMRVASVAKAYSGAVALALVSAGRLSLDDTIGERLPHLPEAWAPVTLRQLLNHTSGLPDYTASSALGARVEAAPHEPLHPWRLLEYVYDRDLQFAPGSRYAYSNSDNIAVGLMVASTGRSYEQELAARVFRPLGLTETRLPVGFRLSWPYVHGYELEASGPPRDVSTIFSASFAWASGGIVSTPAELNRFIRGYAGGRLFDAETQAEQLMFVDGSSDPPGPGTNAAGLAIFRYETSCGTVYGHTGNFPGYTQFAAATLDGRRSVTVSINTQLRPDIDADVFAALREAEELAVCGALDASPISRSLDWR